MAAREQTGHLPVKRSLAPATGQVVPDSNSHLPAFTAVLYPKRNSNRAKRADRRLLSDNDIDLVRYPTPSVRGELVIALNLQILKSGCLALNRLV
jgi:hypothetical protein